MRGNLHLAIGYPQTIKMQTTTCSVSKLHNLK
jgi:hypothetical protein